jgi:membrane protease YdiL (CAAX protease family)
VSEATRAEPEQGWFGDPAGQFDHRYWKDGHWTTWASVGGRASERPLPPRRQVEPLLALPPRSLWWALGGYLAAIVAATGAAISFDSLAWSVAASTAALYLGLLGATWIVTRRYGTGSLVADLGLRFRLIDLGGGLATATAARALAAAVTIVVLAIGSDDSDSTNVQFDVFEPSDAALYLALAIAVIAAPFVEEIFFRGLLQGALTNWLGPVTGIGLQGALFAVTHYQVDATAIENATIFLAIAAAGVVFGFAYHLTRRLGTSIVAHGLFNLVPAVVILINH